MPIDAVKIPQNVQIEDRVVGPLSLRQIIIMAVGGGFSYMAYSMVQRTYGYVGIPLTVILWTPAVIAAAFAIVNINDLSLLRICFLLFERMQKPGQRVWAPRTGISITVRTSAVPKDEDKKKVTAAVADISTEKKISDLSSVVDKELPFTATQTATPVATAIPQSAPSEAITAATPATDESIQQTTAQTPRPPVNPEQIKVDQPQGISSPAMSDLSVFRDVFPPQNKWPA